MKVGSLQGLLRGYKRDKDKRKLDFGQGKQVDSVLQKAVIFP